MHDPESPSGAPCTALIEDPAAAKEWQNYQDKRDWLKKRLQELQTALRNISELPATRAYAANQDALMKRLSQLQEQHEYLREIEAGLREWIAIRRSAETGNRRAAAEIRRSLREDTITPQELNDVPAPIIADAMKIQALLTRPIAELETDLTSRGEQMVRVKETVDAVLHQLDDLTQQYRDCKRMRKEEVRHAKDALAQLATDLLVWGARDEARLAWFLRNAPERRREVIAAYRHAHPGERCSVEDEAKSGALQPTPGRRPAAHIRKKRRNETAAPASSPPSGNGETRPWQFVFMNEALHRTVLPRDEYQCEKLRLLLASEKLTHANPKHILEVLARVTQMTTQQRQEMCKLAEIEPKGWKISRAGRFRLFLDIDEENRILRFLVRKRREAYRHYHHA